MSVPCSNPCTGCTWNGHNLFSGTVRHAAVRKSSCCRRNVTSAGWWVIVCGIQHILLIPHTASSTTSKCMRHDGDCFYQIMKHPFKYTSVMLSPILISMLIFPQRIERISIAQTTHTKCISALVSALVNVDIFVVATFCC